MDRYDEMTDEVLVAAYRAGDFAAMEHLCKKYQKVVSAYGKKFFIKLHAKKPFILNLC